VPNTSGLRVGLLGSLFPGLHYPAGSVGIIPTSPETKTSNCSTANPSDASPAFW
jgi:hypothetical protein